MEHLSLTCASKLQPPCSSSHSAALPKLTAALRLQPVEKEAGQKVKEAKDKVRSADPQDKGAAARDLGKAEASLLNLKQYAALSSTKMLPCDASIMGASWLPDSCLQGSAAVSCSTPTCTAALLRWPR